jgi:hypothetical protein
MITLWSRHYTRWEQATVGIPIVEREGTDPRAHAVKTVHRSRHTQVSLREQKRTGSPLRLQKNAFCVLPTSYGSL